MNDRKRVNVPPGGTTAPLFSKLLPISPEVSDRSGRSRQPNTLRKMFLKTGVTPSASGSAYLELASSSLPCPGSTSLSSLLNSGLKITCTVHGPRPVARSAPFSPTIILSTHVKYAPFATSHRRSCMRNTNERDLAVHLESTLRGVIIGDRWPKSAVEVMITILEGEDDCWRGEEEWKMHKSSTAEAEGLIMMSVLSGCITAASAAIADAGIDCVDVVCGGVAALVQDLDRPSDGAQHSRQPEFVLDPVCYEHDEILAACVVGYLPSRDEITSIWVRGEMAKTEVREGPMKDPSLKELADKAVRAALGAHLVIRAAVTEAAEARIKR